MRHCNPKLKDFEDELIKLFGSSAKYRTSRDSCSGKELLWIIVQRGNRVCKHVVTETEVFMFAGSGKMLAMEIKRKIDGCFQSTAIKPKESAMDSNVLNVIEKHKDRAEKGFRKYGVTTERTDLGIAQWLQHLQDELMDAAIYVEVLVKLVAGNESAIKAATETLMSALDENRALRRENAALKRPVDAVSSSFSPVSVPPDIREISPFFGDAGLPE